MKVLKFMGGMLTAILLWAWNVFITFLCSLVVCFLATFSLKYSLGIELDFIKVSLLLTSGLVLIIYIVSRIKQNI